ncbi:MAG: hypothetical protein AAGF23_21175, partial [Acidobacteriota bacterium]
MVLRARGYATLIAAALGAASAALASGPAGEVSLPLAAYERLTADVEAADAERARRRQKLDASIDWTDQRLAVEVLEKEAEIVMELGVQVLGRPDRPRSIPIHGFLDSVTVEGGAPSGGLVVMMGQQGWQAVATSPGEYRLRLSGRIPLHRKEGFDFLELPTIEAPVSGVEVRFGEGMSYEVGDAVLVGETLRGGRRAVELAVETGDAVTVRLWPRAASEASERLLAHAVQAVVVQLRPEGWRRHDVVLYDVSRGELDRFELGLPPGVEVDEAATDEGPVAAVADAGALALHRTERLRSAGYAVVSSALDPAARRVELAGLRPAVEVRATYLVVAGSVAADVEPAKRDSWSRADLDDLPATLGDALGAVDLVAAWRLVPGEDPGGLRIEPLPEAPSS